MPHYVYILYSLTFDKFYIGSTSDTVEKRLHKHNSNHSGFTGRSTDWKLMYKEEYSDKMMALKREKQIKAWKSRKRIEALVISAK